MDQEQEKEILDRIWRDAYVDDRRVEQGKNLTTFSFVPVRRSLDEQVKDLRTIVLKLAKDHERYVVRKEEKND